MSIYHQRQNKGNIILSVMFVVLMSLMGISLLTVSVMHTRIVKARTIKDSTLRDMTQDFLYYLHYFRASIFNTAMDKINEPETEFFNAGHFPAREVNDTLFPTPSFTFVDYSYPLYKKTRITANIQGTRKWQGIAFPMQARVVMEMLNGNIPLAMMAFFLNQSITTPVDIFLKENHIRNISDKNVVVQESGTQFALGEFLLDALKISGTVLSWREIRQRCGLPLSDEPILPGIHFVLEMDTAEVAAIFIQGDVERLIFSVTDEMQTIHIIKGTIDHTLSYNAESPSLNCWDTSIPQDWLFREKIIVNGNVWSIEQGSDGAAFRENTNLILLVSGTAVIRSSLEGENSGLSLKKIKLSNLSLTCGKEDVFNGGQEQAEVVVDTEEKTKLDISVQVEGKLTNKNKQAKVTLQGSLYCKELENNGEIILDYGKSPAANGTESFFYIIGYKYIDTFFIPCIEEVNP